MASGFEPQLRQESAKGRRFWPQFLHGRLVHIPYPLLMPGLLGTIGIIFWHVRSRISAEVTSSVRLAHALAISALRNVASAGSQFAAFAALAYDMPQVRHVQFHLAATDDTALPTTRPGITGPAQPRTLIMASLMAPPPVVQSIPVVVRGNTVGRLMVQ